MFTLAYRLWLGVRPRDSRYELAPTPAESALRVALVVFVSVGGPVVAVMAMLRGDWIAAVGVLVMAIGGGWLFATEKESVWLCRERVSAPGRPAFLVQYSDITRVTQQATGGVLIAGRAKRLFWTAPDTRLFRVLHPAQFLGELRQRIDEVRAGSADAIFES